MDIIDIPEANTIRINVGSGVIIHDNSNNLIYTEIEPTRLINQIATYEYTMSIISPPNRVYFYIICMIVFNIALICLILIII